MTSIEENDEAEDIVSAVLSVLSEQLDADSAARLVDRLPEGVGESVSSAGDETDYKLEEFFEEVTARSVVEQDPEAISYYARAVLSVLYDADIGGDDLDLEAMLSDEYGPLFEFVHGVRPWDKYDDSQPKGTGRSV